MAIVTVVVVVDAHYEVPGITSRYYKELRMRAGCRRHICSVKG